MVMGDRIAPTPILYCEECQGPIILSEVGSGAGKPVYVHQRLEDWYSSPHKVVIITEGTVPSE